MCSHHATVHTSLQNVYISLIYQKLLEHGIPNTNKNSVIHHILRCTMI